MPFGSGDFAENPENRCPCILLLDTSGSMRGQAINELNAGLQQFREELLSDPMAAKDHKVRHWRKTYRVRLWRTNASAMGFREITNDGNLIVVFAL